MGVRGLTRYVTENDLLVDFTIPRKYKSSNSKFELEESTLNNGFPSTDSKFDIASLSNQFPYNLVIDGHSVLHYLYKENFNCVFGQYSEFSGKIKSFFNSLQEFEIKIVGIVFDEVNGHPGSRQLNLENVLTNTRDVASILKCLREGPIPLKHDLEWNVRVPLPCLCLYVFINALNELGLPIYLPNGLGDQSVASLAEFMDAFVLANDSDFMIYELKRGYLPISEFNLNTGKCKLYHVKALSDHLELPSSFLKLYAAAIGNKMVSFDDLRYLYPRINTKYPKAVHFHIWSHLLKFKHLPVQTALTAFLTQMYTKQYNEGPSLDEWKKLFLSIFEFYTFSPACLSEISTNSKFGPYGLGRLIPKHPFFKCNYLLEDLSKPSAWIVSRRLRKLFYSNFSEKDHVIEMIRTQTGEIEEYPVKVSRRSTSAVILEQLITPYQGDALVFALKYLVEYNYLSFTVFFAIVMAVIVPPPPCLKEIQSLSLHRETLHAIACLETTMVSWAMVTKQPLKRVVESLLVHYFYEQLLLVQTKIVSFVIELFAEEYANALVEFLKLILGEDFDLNEMDLEGDGCFWIFDLT
ncbi:Protein asteroid 1 [Coelomomyces lativittatus]|nr:Protein asteroid 1 [Coelomomyces lativittatus]KAJ1512970.1 Protein asteroid 1 [Coelomomyces lativittatus]KAJ1517581.1 Protein asteroid 1 [Coelomomyces lativittatus]